MEIQRENIDKLTAVVKIKLTPEDYKPKYDAQIRDAAKKMTVPGFRKGMVPSGHVRKLHGKSILVDEVNRLLSDSLNNYIKENNLDILGQPLPKADNKNEITWEVGQEFNFDYELGLAPTIDVTPSEKDKIQKYKIEVDPETFADRLKNMRRAYGKFSEVDEVQDENIIVAEVMQLNEEGSLIEGGVAQTANLRMDLVEDKKIKKALLGKKKGDSLNVNLFDALGKSDSKLAGLLKVSPSEAVALKGEFLLKVEKINKVEESEINQEFFDKVFGEGNVKTEEEFNTKLKEDLMGMFSQHAEQKFAQELQDFYLKKVKIELPKDFLKRWLRAINEDKISDQEIEEGFEDFSKKLTWSLIEENIAKQAGIEIDYDEIMEFTKSRIAEQFAMYGQQLDETQANEYAVNYLQDRDRYTKSVEEIRNMKVMSHLNGVVTVKEKAIGYKDFTKL
ncbi:MAG: trigger factor [Sphingobacteriales bacterium]|jgi:trigger factor